MRRRKTLLLGNGINQISGGGTSWESVLRSAASYVGNPNIMSGWDLKSLPLIYEELYSEHVGKNQLSEFQLKKFVANKIVEVESNDFHTGIIDSAIQNVITTNYDFALEDSVETKWSKENTRRETKYSRFRRNKIEHTYVWHIHGACDAPNTIQLGHEHYSGQLQHLRDLVVGFGKKTKINKQKSIFLQRIEDFESCGSPFSWLDVFLRDNVHILGLGMDFSEIDLWWALAYKNRLSHGIGAARARGGHSKPHPGSTTYHVLERAADASGERAKQEIMKSLGIIIHPHADNRGYKGMYEAVIEIFKKERL